MTHDERALADEQQRLRKLRLLVDLTVFQLRERPLTRADAEALVQQVRQQVLSLFPGTEAQFDLIYAPRFRRVIDERFGGSGQGSTP